MLVWAESDPKTGSKRGGTAEAGAFVLIRTEAFLYWRASMVKKGQESTVEVQSQGVALRGVRVLDVYHPHRGHSPRQFIRISLQWELKPDGTRKKLQPGRDGTPAAGFLAGKRRLQF
jgi:hypothetical protein